jgi:hypothetical protein
MVKQSYSQVKYKFTKHSLVSLLISQYGNQLKLNYLIYTIIDNFMIYELLTRVAT